MHQGRKTEIKIKMSANYHLTDKTEVHDDTLNVVCKADTCTLFIEYINKRTKKNETHHYQDIGFSKELSTR